MNITVNKDSFIHTCEGRIIRLARVLAMYNPEQLDLPPDIKETLRKLVWACNDLREYENELEKLHV